MGVDSTELTQLITKKTSQKWSCSYLRQMSIYIDKLKILVDKFCGFSSPQCLNTPSYENTSYKVLSNAVSRSKDHIHLYNRMKYAKSFHLTWIERFMYNRAGRQHAFFGISKSTHPRKLPIYVRLILQEKKSF